MKQTIISTLVSRRKKYSTARINEAIHTLVERNQIMVEGKGRKYFKVKYASQVKSDPPTLLLFCNRSQNIPANYMRYLKNGMSRALELKNTPLHLVMRTRSNLKNFTS